MTKQDIIREIAKKEEIPLNKAKGIVENIFNMITESLENHEKVTISSFGSFGIVDQQPKRFKNPKINSQLSIVDLIKRV